MIIRRYKQSDCKYLTELFYDTVHSLNVKDYTEEQVNVWATGNVNLEEWNKSLLEHYSVVAVENNMIVGFGDIDKTGYLDRLFVHKNYQHKGIATAICNELENSVDTVKISTHASITARHFFISRGYKVIKEQQVVRNGIALTNYKMEK
ncbi:GNAT family N-acetyltransferase [Clostridium sporogenes]|uniref:GNAT family N-acetyltransferase n=1 Tax=unclassified Clostridium TaxID=2614128 RepID=UPI0013D05BC8|nr:GNAT family N-acetyltransferase [Clostridium sporogenes]NFS24443.1 GNAT family N-acetyltransferase [Clostridium sporogenes]